MNQLLQAIKDRIKYLKEQETDKQKEIDSVPGYQIGTCTAFYSGLAIYTERRKELEKLLRSLPAVSMEPEPEKPEVRPLASLKQRTPEEDNELHEKMIHSILSHFTTATGIEERLKGFELLKKLNQYFANVAGWLHVAGLIEKLEEMERAGNEDIFSVQEIIDRQLHQAYKEQSLLIENCIILQRELNIQE